MQPNDKDQRNYRQHEQEKDRLHVDRGFFLTRPEPRSSFINNIEYVEDSEAGHDHETINQEQNSDRSEQLEEHASQRLLIPERDKRPFGKLFNRSNEETMIFTKVADVQWFIAASHEGCEQLRAF